MLLAKKLQSLLNGGASTAGVEGLGAAIATLESAMALHRRELADIPGKCVEAALADDAVAATRALRSREEELYAALEVLTIQVGKLREKLAEQINIRRRHRIEHHRREAREKFEALALALRVACVANEAATAAFEAACGELGVADATALVSRADYLPPGAVVSEMVEHWQAVVRRELEMASKTAPRSPTTTTKRTLPAVVSYEPIPHGDVGKGGVALYQMPSRPAAKPPSKGSSR
jgi:hypothetical protein